MKFYKTIIDISLPNEINSELIYIQGNVNRHVFIQHPMGTSSLIDIPPQSILYSLDDKKFYFLDLKSPIDIEFIKKQNKTFCEIYKKDVLELAKVFNVNCFVNRFINEILIPKNPELIKELDAGLHFKYKLESNLNKFFDENKIIDQRYFIESFFDVNKKFYLDDYIKNKNKYYCSMKQLEKKESEYKENEIRQKYYNNEKLSKLEHAESLRLEEERRRREEW